MLHRTIETRGMERAGNGCKTPAKHGENAGEFQQTIASLTRPTAKWAPRCKGARARWPRSSAWRRIALTVYGLVGGAAVATVAAARCLWAFRVAADGEAGCHESRGGHRSRVTINMAERWDLGKPADLWLFPVNTPDLSATGSTISSRRGALRRLTTPNKR